jgi:hypothetical protein
MNVTSTNAFLPHSGVYASFNADQGSIRALVLLYQDPAGKMPRSRIFWQDSVHSIPANPDNEIRDSKSA